ncbi:MAG: hypothetical protein LBM22_00970 [Endomicrobium sp.]|jgi:F-type H+-transporting ATPase subunit epsilon|nr:hypothetical protein [Endomicrobium sp.]
MILKILSIEDIIFSENDVLRIILPTINGQIAILPNHVNFITKLHNGKVLIKTVIKETQINITGGFVEICNNNIWILLNNYITAKNKLLLNKLSNILLLKL